jgi:hypothetical protein
MALNIDTQDLVNYPGTTKRVTVDHEAITPLGYEGDEQYVVSFSTTAYSDNTNRTAIQDLYVTKFKMGWCKSSGFTGSGGKFALSASAYKLYVKVDNTISGTASVNGENGFYQISLSHSSGVPISGESIADDMEEKIRAIADNLETADSGFSTAYKNTSVEYKNGKFWITSGSVGSYYTGSNRTSVKIGEVAGDGAYDLLGFNLQMTSEAMASISAKEAVLSVSYSPGSASMTIGTDIGVAAGDPLMIKDATNTDYFVALSGTTGTSIVVPTSGTNGYGIANSYSANDAKIQILREQDPEGIPSYWFDDVDDIVRYGVKYMTHEIDYSS